MIEYIIVCQKNNKIDKEYFDKKGIHVCKYEAYKMPKWIAANLVTYWNEKYDKYGHRYSLEKAPEEK